MQSVKIENQTSEHTLLSSAEFTTPSARAAAAVSVSAASSENKIPTDQDFTSIIQNGIPDFEDMDLPETLLRGIYNFGFEHPSQVQSKAIVPAKSGRDIIIQAQSGTGKTGAFSISVLAQLDTSVKSCQAILLSPCRELAIQTSRVVTCLGDYMGVQSHVLVGGHSVKEDIDILKHNQAHVVCGTPGRVYHMIMEGFLNTRDVICLVLDEADVMLDDGFKEQVYNILQEIPTDTQVLLVSATLNKQTMEISTRFLRNPLKILLEQSLLKLEGIQHFYVLLDEERYKLSVLCDLYESLCVSQSIIFINSKQRAERLAQDMRQDDFSVSIIHSQMTQLEREETMRDFKAGRNRVLIATDLIARGVDVQQVSTVINFDLPHDPANYVHRVGRGGRFGRQAITINLVTERDQRKLREIEKYLHMEVEELPSNINQLLK